MPKDNGLVLHGIQSNSEVQSKPEDRGLIIYCTLIDSTGNREQILRINRDIKVNGWFTWNIDR